MTLLRQLAVAVCLAIVAMFALATAVLAQPGFFQPAGNYSNHDVSAGFSSFAFPVQISVQVDVLDDTSSPSGAPTAVTNETDVQFQACDFTSQTCGGGCFIPDGASDFTFSSDLSSARLSTMVTGTKTCRNNPMSGFTPPFQLTVTWAGGPSSGTSTNLTRYSCMRYTSETLTATASGNNTMATVVTSPVGSNLGPFFSGLNTFDQNMHVQGTIADGCQPVGGKGAGPGPRSPGDYHFQSKDYFASAQPDDFSQGSISVHVSSFTNVFHPIGGAPTVQTETDLNFFQFQGFQAAFDCWVIPASALTPTTQGAMLHVQIDANTRACPQVGQNVGFPTSFTVDVTWTVNGPLASSNTLLQGGCGFHATIGSTGQNAPAMGTISGVATNFSSPEASLGSLDSSFHITSC